MRFGRRRSDSFHRRAEVELQQFRGRLFVTAGWRSEWGVSIPSDPSPHQVGRSLLDGLDRGRRNPRPLIEDAEEHHAAELREAKGWAAFCIREAGVSENEYRPEIRLQLYEHGDDTLHLRPFESQIDPANGVSLPGDVSASELGERVLQLLSETRPDWPTLRAAVAHAAPRGRIVVLPTKFKIGGPARVVRSADPSGVVGDAVRLALRDSEALHEDDPAERYEQAMLAVGINERQIAQRRAATISFRSDGTVVVTAMRPVQRRGWEPIAGGDLLLPDDTSDALGAGLIRALTWDYLQEPDISA